MKNARLLLLSALAVLFFVTSCSKTEPEPIMGDQVAGKYTITAVTSGGIKIALPFNNPVTGIELSGKIDVTKIADDKVKAIVSLIDKDKAGKTTTDNLDFGEVTLKKAASGSEIEGYQNNVKVGTYANNILTFSAIDPDTKSPISIEAKKN
ncbi:MAG: hypothetical protein MUE30_12325 [Spirosomaceae bacterium]|jgi:hypothetical protein|nr:hypothetical protein [Spirosomataceae bacterium]